MAASKAQCASNLKEIGALLIERNESKGWPGASGPAFLLQLYVERPEKEAIAHLLRCPAHEKLVPLEKKDNFALLKGLTLGNLDQADHDSVSYAGRNMRDFPLDRHPKNPEPIACDDNPPGAPHHGGGLNVLYSDGSVRYSELSDLEPPVEKIEDAKIGKGGQRPLDKLLGRP
jgi:prepilin-type processing-associated H-X9-DG protein